MTPAIGALKLILRSACLLFAVPLFAAGNDDAPSEIVANYNTIEAQCHDWITYSCAGSNLDGGHGFQEQVWLSDDSPEFTKVESRTFDELGERSTEFYLVGYDLIFVLDRSETTLNQAGAPTRVEEKRLYFSGGKLVRVLEKEASFPPGKKPDMAGVKNTSVPPGSIDASTDGYDVRLQTANALTEKLRRLGDTGHRGAEAVTGGGKWRVIAGSCSPDGRYALAWGLKGRSIPEADRQEDGSYDGSDDADEIVNYVVDVKDGTIAGATDGRWSGDRSQYNHLEADTAWSRDSVFVAQVEQAKWETTQAAVYALNHDGSALSRGVDLIKPASDAAFKYLKGSAVLKAHSPGDFSITVSGVRIVTKVSGIVIQMEVLGQIPKDEDENGSFDDVTVTFSLAAGEDGAAPVLEWLDTRGPSDASR